MSFIVIHTQDHNHNHVLHFNYEDFGDLFTKKEILVGKKLVVDFQLKGPKPLMGLFHFKITLVGLNSPSNGYFYSAFS